MKFKVWPKTPRLENEEFVITEKIDGTNACIVILKDGRFKDGYNVFAQSRKRVLTLEDDNFDFAAFVQTHREELLTLGIGYHYGEWWGQGIQRNYGLKERKFSLFYNRKYKLAILPACCGSVPVIYRTKGSLLHDLYSCKKSDLDIAIQLLEKFGSFAVKGYMNPEGVVVQSTLYPDVRYKYIISK